MFAVFALFLATAQCAAHASDPGADAVLPDVNSILTNATAKVHQFSRSTVDAQREVVKQQQVAHYALRDQKDKYEAMLEAQEVHINATETDIQQLKVGNVHLRRMNMELEANLTAMQEKNRHLRATMRALGEKVETARLFVEESLRVADDTDADVLQVLTPPTLPPTLESFLATTDYEKAEALLQVEPQDFVDSMASKLSEIVAAEEQGAEQLKQLFDAQFAAGEQKQAALNATRQHLLEVRSSLKAHYGKLLEARDFLEHAGYVLRTRTSALRVFAQKMEAFVGDTLDVGDDAKSTDVPMGAKATDANSNSAVRDGNTTHSMLRRPAQASQGEWLAGFR